ncbi:hypothetical protein GLOTRDRAFT_112845 [Gloeophyllum trabeum ATCC 11539]|uniref:T6SS Phospholipase effector Tle1-like catalytic domain-containing protein n=1 Tax=Gloeophyllum trabeum (strain ATCC 11539 / FP-39264 / Madison 617) TaxID=670483 RepID=S7QL92_GLOTA|nr:uncharacterized protein GLOTRDRAFT_112845 [Gloeophyllum trabeum ATCC 11539]EPQ60078.1 hypothetical protein GLOTRDRAFT_112845 [Gloeophyllum trabeum ATCC 11539]
MHAARTLILCFDGTGDQFDDDNSNVVQLVSMLKKHDPDEQMVYYQTGIGTYTGPGATVNSFTRTFWKLADQAVAWSLSYHVQGGYEFLMSHYRAGDKICIFGFSRGAYTARALAGMLHKVGLLPPGNRQTVPFAYKMFRREDDRGWAQSTAFKKAFCIDVDIEFLGVWDTVASVGLIPRHLPFTTNNTSIKTFRQAVSLDEHRAKFKVNHWHRHSPEQEKLGTQPGDMPRSSRRAAHPDQHDNGDGKHTDKGKHTQKKTKGRGWTKTDVLEVWFAGCHADVGGGSVRNDTPHSLSRIPLRWMVRQCFLARTGILFHGRALRAFGVDPAALYPTVQPRPPALGLRDNTVLCEHLSKVAAEGKCADSIPGSKDIEFGKVGKMASEEEEDLADALCPLYDELTIAKWWWILEILPLRVRQQAENASWFSCWTIHLGRPRELPKHHLRAGVKVHRTVKTRMEAAKMLKGAHYNPRVVFDGDPTWVD